MAQFVSYAQHGEDVILWRAFAGRPSGTYVDVGAFHPTFDSVTRALYERGWRGVNIEPQADLIPAFEQERPEDTTICAAIGDHDGRVALSLTENLGWATIREDLAPLADDQARREVDVPLRSLESLFRELGITSVDVLKIDVEGAEPDVVRGMLAGDVRPTVCVVEGVAPGVGTSAGDEAVDMLVGAGYMHCLFDGLNHYLTVDPNLRGALSIPANPTDDYVTDDMRRLMAERLDLLSLLSALSSDSARKALLGDLTSPTRAEPRALPEASVLQATNETSLEDRASVVLGPGGLDDAQRGQGSFVDPRTRADRRRGTLRRLVSRPLAEGEPAGEPLGLVEALAPGSRYGAEAIVRSLYTNLLRREPESAGLVEWSDALRSGGRPLETAWGLASSDEGILRARTDGPRAIRELTVVEAVDVLDRLGVAWLPRRLQSDLPADEQLFVVSLYEVALHRQPSAQELRREVDALRSGKSPERLLRAFASRVGLPAGGTPSVRALRLLLRIVRHLGWGRTVRSFRMDVRLTKARETARIAAVVDDAPELAMRLFWSQSKNGR